jgi:RNA polymerase sigma-70 factor (ECF subfamily)
MVRYQHGDPAATEELVARLSPPLFRFLGQASYAKAHAEDLLQECWLRIHKARHTYRREAPVLPWVYAIARHTRVDDYRRRLRTEFREESIDKYREPAATIAGNTPFNDEALMHAVDQLPNGQREVILMLKVSGLSLEDVARATSSTTGAVKQKAHRAYESLRRLLSEDPR